MKNYDDYLAQLPLGNSINKGRLEEHPWFISFDDDSSRNVAYFKINETDACAVVISGYSKEDHCIRLKNDINSYTLRLVYLWSSNSDSFVYIPETVWSIYGAEKWTNDYWPPFVFETGNNPRWMDGQGSQYFNFVEFDGDEHIYWLVSTDGEDVIYGVCDGNIDAKLKGVKTIHCLRQLNQGYDSAKKTSLSIPASVERIKKIDGDFTEVTFEGTLPELYKESLKNTTFNQVKVLTAFDMSPKDSVNLLLKGISKDKLLFAAHSLTKKKPESKGYIALTNARFDCDGETILANTPWIATICPKTYSRSDEEVKGSVVLIGLKDSRQEYGVTYDVYESPEIIEKKIVNAQS